MLVDHLGNHLRLKSWLSEELLIKRTAVVKRDSLLGLFFRRQNAEQCLFVDIECLIARALLYKGGNSAKADLQLKFLFDKYLV